MFRAKEHIADNDGERREQIRRFIDKHLYNYAIGRELSKKKLRIYQERLKRTRSGHGNG